MLVETKNYCHVLIYNSYILQVCRDASMMSMRRKIAGLNCEQIKALSKEELDLPVSAQDFEEAIRKVNKSVI